MNGDSVILRGLLVVVILVVVTMKTGLYWGACTDPQVRLLIYETALHCQGMAGLTLLLVVGFQLMDEGRSCVMRSIALLFILMGWCWYEFWMDWQGVWQWRQYVFDITGIRIGLSVSDWIVRPMRMMDRLTLRELIVKGRH